MLRKTNSELAKDNLELSKEIVRLCSAEVGSEVTYDNLNNNFMGKLSGNTVPHIQIPVNPSSSSCSTTAPPVILLPMDGSAVVNTGELINTNFIDGEITNYNKIYHTVLTSLN